MVSNKPERWSSRIGIVLAVTGSAIGLGNFFRFPTQAAQYGGVAFLVPYLCALLLLGLPLMWLEWALGRYGGIWGRHSLPGIYDQVTRRSWGKYLGVLGLYLPFTIVVYYLYIESWTLGYTFLTATGAFAHIPGANASQLVGQVLDRYLGVAGAGHLAVPTLGLLFLGVTLLINFYVAYHGAEAGIERLNYVALPLLGLLAVTLVAYVFTMPGAGDAISYLWRISDIWSSPHFAILNDPKLWMAATGQVFFSLSLGLGAVITYSSFIRKDDDVALAGLTTVSLNTFAEVILGASVTLFAGFILFHGVSGVQEAAAAGPFSLGFLAMPLLFQKLLFGNYVGALWFLFLFFAGVTSSVSLLQPILAFFQDELNWTRPKSTLVLFGLTLLYLTPVVLLQHHHFLHEMDFWAVQVLLPLAVLIEVLVFAAVLGSQRGWEAITAGAYIRLPGIFRIILFYLTPLVLVYLLGWWAWQEIIPTLRLDYIAQADHRVIELSRVVMGVVFLAMMLVLRFAWQRKLETEEKVEELIAVEVPDDVV